jgi:hypothetical protein
MTFEKSALAQARLHELIPGGAHTHARGCDQCPEDRTPILFRGRGARVEDLDGNWLIEYGMGLRAITLGHGYEPVVAEVRNAAAGGVNFSRPDVWDLRAAEDFLGQVPGADIVPLDGFCAPADTLKERAALGETHWSGNQPWALWETSTGSEFTTRMPGRTLKCQQMSSMSGDHQTRWI